MNEPQTGAIFQTTNWSLIVSAGADEASLAQLLGAYWGPIYAFIRRSGSGRDRAADLTQDFIAQVVIERELIGRADPDRGRFRTFLKSALRNFLIDGHRRASAKGRSPVAPVLGSGMLDLFEPEADDDPGAAFDRMWATRVLTIALERLEADCSASGQQLHWDAFKAVVVEPSLRHVAAPSQAEVARALKIDSVEQVASLVQTVRRKFRRIVREVVSETLARPGDVDAEMADLMSLFGLS